MVLEMDNLSSTTSGPTHKPTPLPIANPSKSFWHSEPSKFLQGHRTTPDLPRSADIVIIGSGITGASAARYLSEGGRTKEWNVVMLEAREACSGATGRNGGHLQPLLFDRTPAIAAFELRNCAEVRSYIESHNITETVEFRSLIGCRTFWTDPLLAEAIDLVDQLKKDAPDIGKRVKVATARAELMKHRLSEECPGATLTQGAASLWPYKYVAFMLENLIKSGRLNLQTNTPATKINPLPIPSQPPSSSSSSWRSPRWTVNTPRGPISTRHILLATNGWTTHLLPSLSDILVPVRGTMTALLPPTGSKRLDDSYGFVGTGPGANPNSDDYLIQRPFSGVPNPKGHLMFGGGRSSGDRESVGDADDSVVDEASVRYLKKTLLRTLELGGSAKDMEELEAEYVWSGIMCYSRDNSPWVGAVPGPRNDGLWICAGYTGHGMPNAPLCAKAVVKMLVKEEEGMDVMEATRSVVRSGNLPAEYVMTEGRLQASRGLPTVKEQDVQGIVGYSGGSKVFQEKL